MFIGVDIGGTFTDIVCSDDRSGRLHVTKVSTSHGDVIRGVLAGEPGRQRYPRFAFVQHENRARPLADDKIGLPMTSLVSIFGRCRPVMDRAAILDAVAGAASP